MKLGTHESYKESGIAGLGLIPKHWRVQRIKDAVVRIASGVTPKGGSEVYVDEGTPFLRSQNVHDGGLRLGNVSFITEAVNAKMRSSQTKPGDIVLNITGASIGRACVVPDTVKQANISQHILLLRFKKYRVAYAANYIQSRFIKDYIDTIQLGASKQALNMGQALNFPLLLPPQDEQLIITKYLAERTAAIDQKTRLLEQKIKHYQALRKTLINETVCRGLHPEASRKDSGIEWIGEIPAHWDVRRLKDFAYSVKGKTAEGYDNPLDDTSVPVLSLEYLRNKKSVNPTYLTPTNKATLVTSKDYIIIWDGAGVGEMLKGKRGVLSSTVAKLVFDQKIMHGDFCYFLREPIEYTVKSIPAGMGIPHLNPVVLNTFQCPCPPLEEQLEIITFLRAKSRTIDNITANLKSQISALQELRKTLINDVVTGKLRVTA